MDAYVVRDVTFIVVQFYACATIYLATQAMRVTLLTSVLMGALLSLVVTEWSPSVLSAIVVPLLAGSLPGLVLGEILLTVFDRFDAHHAGDATAAAATTTTGDSRYAWLCQSTETTRFAPVTLVAGVLGQLLLLLLPLAVSSAALQWVMFLHAGLLLSLNVAVGLVLRRVNGPYARAWFIFGLLTVLGQLIMLSAIAFSTIFWSVVVYICTGVLTMLATFAVAPFTSNDVRKAMTTITDSSGPFEPQPVTAPLTVGSTYATVPLPSISSKPMASMSTTSGSQLHPVYPPYPPANVALPQTYSLTNLASADDNERGVLDFFNSFTFKSRTNDA